MVKMYDVPRIEFIANKLNPTMPEVNCICSNPVFIEKEKKKEEKRSFLKKILI